MYTFSGSPYPPFRPLELSGELYGRHPSTYRIESPYTDLIINSKLKRRLLLLLKEITKDEILTMDTPCCNNVVHCELFEKWKGIRTSFCGMQMKKQLHAPTVELRFQSQTRVSFA